MLCILQVETVITTVCRYYTVQLAEGSGPWLSIQERVDPSLTSYTASGLKPFTSYRFRIQATNDIGPSGWSTESAQVRTLPAGALLYLQYLCACIQLLFLTTNYCDVQLFILRLCLKQVAFQKEQCGN